MVASGGAGGAAHLREAFDEGGASAALVAGILHDRNTTVAELKNALAGWGMNVRAVAAMELAGTGYTQPTEERAP